MLAPFLHTFPHDSLVLTLSFPLPCSCRILVLRVCWLIHSWPPPPCLCHLYYYFFSCSLFVFLLLHLLVSILPFIHSASLMPHPCSLCLLCKSFIVSSLSLLLLVCFPVLSASSYHLHVPFLPFCLPSSCLILVICVCCSAHSSSTHSALVVTIFSLLLYVLFPPPLPILPMPVLLLSYP